MHAFTEKDWALTARAGGNILALKMGVPEDQYEDVVTSLRKSIAAKGGHLDTGIFGTRFFLKYWQKME